ncbi:MAG: TrkH family potassium uptake protein, partial [Planctomycetota bacterium]
MNYRLVLRQLGLLMLVLGGGMGMMAGLEYLIWADLGRGERVGLIAMGASALIGAAVGLGLWRAGRSRDATPMMSRREALLLVACGWVLGAAVSGLPYWLWATVGGAGTGLPGEVDEPHVFRSYIASYFEAMSGLTTTGATVLGDIGGLPNSLLLWRATTHWLGGLGIVVLFVAVLPIIGTGGKKLFNVEAPGPQQQGVRPRIGDTARLLWMIYTGITLAALASFRLAGMSWFDAVCHSFSVVSTGGLSTRDASIGHFDSVAIDGVSMLFMLLAGVNFGLMFAAVRGRWSAVWRDEELRVYLALKVAVIAIVAIDIHGREIVTTGGNTIDATLGQALRYAGFQTISLHTGTGFCTADYDLWPFVSRTLIVGLMFIGGCAGSTAGGIKVIRFWIALKVIAASLERSFRPQVVRPLRVGSAVIDEDRKLSAVTYCVFVLLIFAVGAMAIGFLESRRGVDVDFLTAATASLSTLGNIGPGFDRIGATGNYGWFSDGSLAVMSLLMMLGRLEI